MADLGGLFMESLHPSLQSQRDCVLQPRVARNELPWGAERSVTNPEGVPSDQDNVHRATSSWGASTFSNARWDPEPDGRGAGVRGKRAFESPSAPAPTNGSRKAFSFFDAYWDHESAMLPRRFPSP